MKKQRVDWNTLKWIYNQTSCARGSLIVLLFVKILKGAEGILFAFLLRDIVDCAVAQDWVEFKTCGIKLCLLVIMAIFLNWGVIYFTDKPTAKLTKAYRLHSYSELLTRSYKDIQ